EYTHNIREQIQNIELSKDIISTKYKNYAKEMEEQGQELLNSFKKIEVNRDKNLKLVLYITAGISITTLIACGAILFKLFKLFH
ncbi:hypothetical protein PZR46_06380, partial [Aliarcobacter butzleri]